ncbi:MAG: hypothetical protein KDA80_04855 [Planctomycetaceae bacterium]|nr:hypothetical protein [Planctomycetaceae bacterium]
MRSEASIEIQGPIDEIFRITTEDVAAWSRTVIEDKVIEEHPGVVGTKFHVVTQENDQRMEFEGVVTRFEPPLAHGSFLTGKLFDIDVAYLFEELSPDQTRVHQISEVHGKGWFRLLLKVVKFFAADAGNGAALEELRRLKSYCERQPSEKGEVSSSAHDSE